MNPLVSAVIKGSIADQLGIVKGDTILSINGEPICDLIDLQFLEAAETLTIQAICGGEEVEFQFEKDLYEPLGLEFSSSLIDEQRTCKNKCVFCFVDQLPKRVRPSLIVKDDDWRLSFIMGNYVTLTNVSDAELERIIKRRVSPLYISVHAWDGAVRAGMLKNPAAAKLREQLKKLADAGIAFHCQIVLCPGINDGAVLEQTVNALSELYPAALSLAVVPVGLTAHREGLPRLEGVTKPIAETLIESIHAWQAKFKAKLGDPFIYAADELYLKAEHDLPPYEAYGDFPQIENGVGLLRMFEQELDYALSGAEKISPRRLALATGKSAETFMCRMCEKLRPFGADITVYGIDNAFFGSSITVAGLVTGGDIALQLDGRPLYDALLLPRCMLRETEDVFLDDMTPDELSQRLGVPIITVEVDGADFVRAALG